MEKKYTPGPWALVHFPRGMQVCSPTGPIALVQWGYSRGGKSALADETWANARLIAAAPELLEALEAIVATDAPCPFPNHDPRYVKWFRLLGGDGIVPAAIAKAKGGRDA